MFEKVKRNIPKKIKKHKYKKQVWIALYLANNRNHCLSTDTTSKTTPVTLPRNSAEPRFANAKYTFLPYFTSAVRPHLRNMA